MNARHRNATPPPPPIDDEEDPRDLSFAERVTLFLNGLQRAQSERLLEGFAESLRVRAVAFNVRLNANDSATRQGRLLRELGVRRDALSRLRKLIVEAPVGLRVALCQAIPPRFAPEFPCVEDAPVTTPGMRALASRLVLEAIR